MKIKIPTKTKVWIIAGIIILLWTLFWYFKRKTYTGAYFITLALFETVGFFLLIVYIIITILILIYKFIKNKK